MFEDIYGLPQPITGQETVTILQEQGGQLARCTMPLSSLLSLITPQVMAQLAALSKTEPTEPGVLWNNNGVLSVS